MVRLLNELHVVTQRFKSQSEEDLLEELDGLFSQAIKLATMFESMIHNDVNLVIFEKHEGLKILMELLFQSQKI